MQFTLNELVHSLPALATLAEKEMPAKTAYRVGKLLRKMKSEVDEYNKARNALLLKMGTPLENPPGTFSIPPENRQSFRDEEDALLNESVELNGVALIALSSISHLEIAPSTLADLQPFIVEDD